MFNEDFKGESIHRPHIILGLTHCLWLSRQYSQYSERVLSGYFFTISASWVVAPCNTLFRLPPCFWGRTSPVVCFCFNSFWTKALLTSKRRLLSELMYYLVHRLLLLFRESRWNKVSFLAGYTGVSVPRLSGICCIILAFVFCLYKITFYEEK